MTLRERLTFDRRALSYLGQGTTSTSDLPMASGAVHLPASTGWAKKPGHRLMTTILSNINRFLKKLQLNGYWKSHPTLHVATVPTLMSAKQAINDKLQGSVATYLRCGGVVNNRIKKGLLLSVWVKLFLNRWIFGRVTSKSLVVSCTLRAWPIHC